MRRERFVEERRAGWAELESLLQRAQRSLRQLDGPEVFRLGQLYLAATADLAVARRDFPTDQVTDYLNDLVARTHPVVYRQRATSLRRIGYFVRYGFPQAYRDAGGYIAASFAAFVLSAIVSGLLVLLHPTLADTLLPGDAQALRSVMEHHHLWMKANTSNHPIAANVIMLNNIRVALYAFAGGIVLTIPSLLIEAQNGLMLGTVGAIVHQYGLSEGFWSFVLPHGVIELSVIFMAGGAGMMMGDAVLRPGALRRRDAVVRAARHALQLTLGGACLLVIAGTIEGFFSPSDAPDWTKYLVGITTGILLYGYLLGSRPRARRTVYRFEDVLGSRDTAIAVTEQPAP